MGTRAVLLAILVIGCVAVLAVPAPQARGEDEAQAVQGGKAPLWVFDARVVRVVTADLATPEQAGAWEPGGDGTTTTAWPEILKALKERGETQLLADTRVTTVWGREAHVQETRDQQIKQFQSSDFTTERHGASNVNTGCTLKLKADPGLGIQYDVTLKWVLPPLEEDMRALLGVTSWSGNHGGLKDRTLVLCHRQQCESVHGGVRGLEFYVLLTAHLVE